jgi:hypothetical protein
MKTENKMVFTQDLELRDLIGQSLDYIYNLVDASVGKPVFVFNVRGVGAWWRDFKNPIFLDKKKGARVEVGGDFYATRGNTKKRGNRMALTCDIDPPDKDMPLLYNYGPRAEEFSVDVFMRKTRTGRYVYVLRPGVI